jgi:hypothetical protein
VRALLAGGVAAVVLVGCGTAPKPRTTAERYSTADRTCYRQLSEVPRLAIPDLPDPEQKPKPKPQPPMQFGSVASCVEAANGEPYPVVVFDVTQQVPVQIDLSLLVADNSAFAARVELLTADYQRVRSVPFSDFVRRGGSFTGSVFLNPIDRDVKLLVLVPDTDAVGTAVATTAGETHVNTVVVPVGAGVVAFNIYSGSERQTRDWLSEVGPFTIQARPYAPPAARPTR